MIHQPSKISFDGDSIGGRRKNQSGIALLRFLTRRGEGTKRREESIFDCFYTFYFIVFFALFAASLLRVKKKKKRWKAKDSRADDVF
jgi:hypothetical protein